MGDNVSVNLALKGASAKVKPLSTFTRPIPIADVDIRQLLGDSESVSPQGSGYEALADEIFRKQPQQMEGLRRNIKDEFLTADTPTKTAIRDLCEKMIAQYNDGESSKANLIRTLQSIDDKLKKNGKPGLDVIINSSAPQVSLNPVSNLASVVTADLTRTKGVRAGLKSMGLALISTEGLNAMERIAGLFLDSAGNRKNQIAQQWAAIENLEGAMRLIQSPGFYQGNMNFPVDLFVAQASKGFLNLSEQIQNDRRAARDAGSDARTGIAGLLLNNQNSISGGVDIIADSLGIIRDHRNMNRFNTGLKVMSTSINENARRSIQTLKGAMGASFFLRNVQVFDIYAANAVSKVALAVEAAFYLRRLNYELNSSMPMQEKSNALLSADERFRRAILKEHGLSTNLGYIMR